MSKSFVMSDAVAKNIVMRDLRDVKESMGERCFLNRKPYRAKNGEMRVRTACCETAGVAVKPGSSCDAV